jgi:hypothetical protein
MENALRRWRLVPFLVLLAVAPWPIGAQLNPSPPPAPAPASGPPATRDESELFFERFVQAEKLVRANRMQEAAIVMDLLSKSLSKSPWLEIAILKHTELLESQNPPVAIEQHTLLHRRLDNSPYFQGAGARAAVFGVTLRAAVERGISRVRIYSIRNGLSRYYARYRQYPESLAKLAIFDYVDMEDVRDYNGRPFRYIPSGQQFTPFITYHAFELEPARPEPFYTDTPQLEGTSLLSDNPPKYAALIRIPGRSEAVRATEDQTVEGLFLATIAERGVIACTQERVLVLPVRE